MHNMKYLALLSSLLLMVACSGIGGKKVTRPAATDSTEIAEVSDTICFAMVGDIMPGNTYPTPQLPKADGTLLFRNVDSILIHADVALGNLEGVLCVGGTSTNIGNPHGYTFRIPPEYVSIFPKAGFDFLNLANNHLRDFGPYGYEMTMHILDSIGMPYAGIKGYRKYSILKRKNKRIGICSFGQNPYCYQHTTDTATMIGILKELRPLCDILVVSVHGGAEGINAAHLPYAVEYYVGENRGDMVKFAHFCIDNGADLIWGHGPHVPRAVELYKDHFIAYSLGNFCTPFGMGLGNMFEHAPIIEVIVSSNGQFIDGKIHSFQQVSGDGPQPDDNYGAAKDIKRLTEEDIKDSRLSISDKGIITKK